LHPRHLPLDTSHNVSTLLLWLFHVPPLGTNGWRRQLYLSYNAAPEGDGRFTAATGSSTNWLKTQYAVDAKHNVYFQ
jgi:hypothetical protein